MYYVLFDTETTGTGQDDRIIQVGSLIFDLDASKKYNENPNNIFDLVLESNIEKYDELCFNEQPISILAMEVHHITPQMIKNAPLFLQTKFYKRLCELNNENNYLIAHNIKFDLSMLNREGFECKYKIIDTYKCALAIFPNEESCRLQYLRYSLKLYEKEQSKAQELGIFIKAHDAISDVFIMKLLLDEMLKIKSIEELHQISINPVLLSTFNFGKYKGESIISVCQKDQNYIQWCLNTFKDNEDLIYSINHALNN